MANFTLFLIVKQYTFSTGFVTEMEVNFNTVFALEIFFGISRRCPDHSYVDQGPLMPSFQRSKSFCPKSSSKNPAVKTVCFEIFGTNDVNHAWEPIRTREYFRAEKKEKSRSLPISYLQNSTSGPRGSKPRRPCRRPREHSGYLGPQDAEKRTPSGMVNSWFNDYPRKMLIKKELKKELCNLLKKSALDISLTKMTSLKAKNQKTQ